MSSTANVSEALEETSQGAAMDDGENERTPEKGAFVFVTLSPWETDDATLEKLFKDRFDIAHAKVSVKPNPANPSTPLSMGFGFVQFWTKGDAMEAIRTMQGVVLNGYAIELKHSNRELNDDSRKKQRKIADDLPTEVIACNLPFNTTKDHVEALFSAYNGLIGVRLGESQIHGNKRFGYGIFLNKDSAMAALRLLREHNAQFKQEIGFDWQVQYQPQRQYLLQLEIEDATRKLDGLANAAERSPSPEPVYDANGKRLNTREVRKKLELEQLREERDETITALLKLNPEYEPPADYRRASTMLPVERVVSEPCPNCGGDHDVMACSCPLLCSLCHEDGHIARDCKDARPGIMGGGMGGGDMGGGGADGGMDDEYSVFGGGMGRAGLGGVEERPRCNFCNGFGHTTLDCLNQPNVTAQIICEACGGTGHIAHYCQNARPGFMGGGMGGGDMGGGGGGYGRGKGGLPGGSQEMTAPSSSLAMYIILRRDLISALNWPVGAIFTQAAHAATAALWTFREDAETVRYMEDMDNMHKVTLGVDSEAELDAARAILEKKNMLHRVWVEDGMRVAIAVKPYPKNTAKDATRQLKLF